MPNREGLTFPEWLAAATCFAGDRKFATHRSSPLYKAWKRGEDPTEWAAAISRGPVDGETPKKTDDTAEPVLRSELSGKLLSGRLYTCLREGEQAIPTRGVPAAFPHEFVLDAAAWQDMHTHGSIASTNAGLEFQEYMCRRWPFAWMRWLVATHRIVFGYPRPANHPRNYRDTLVANAPIAWYD